MPCWPASSSGALCGQAAPGAGQARVPLHAHLFGGEIDLEALAQSAPAVSHASPAADRLSQLEERKSSASSRSCRRWNPAWHGSKAEGDSWLNQEALQRLFLWRRQPEPWPWRRLQIPAPLFVLIRA